MQSVEDRLVAEGGDDLLAHQSNGFFRIRAQRAAQVHLVDAGLGQLLYLCDYVLRRAGNAQAQHVRGHQPMGFFHAPGVHQLAQRREITGLEPDGLQGMVFEIGPEIRRQVLHHFRGGGFFL